MHNSHQMSYSYKLYLFSFGNLIRYLPKVLKVKIRIENTVEIK
jgi:hypothetical protein